MQLNVNSRLFIIPQRQPGIGDPYFQTLLSTSSIKSFETVSTWDELTQTAEIVLSRRTLTQTLYHYFQNTKNSNYTYITPDGSLVNNLVYDPNFFSNLFLNIQEITNNNIETQNIPRKLINNPTPLPSNKPAAGFATKEELYSWIQRGDIIVLYAWYTAPNSNSQNTEYLSNFLADIAPNFLDGGIKLEAHPSNPRFQLFLGYVTSVDSKYDIKIKCQDYMYYLSQITLHKGNFLSNNFTVLQMIQNIFGNNKYVYPKNISTDTSGLNPCFYDDKGNASINLNLNHGTNNLNNNTQINLNAIKGISFASDVKDIRVGNINIGSDNCTFMQLLKELKDKYGCQPFFYPNSNILNILPFKYNDNPYDTKKEPYGYQEWTFQFQKNIIKNELVFKKTSDIQVGGIMTCQYKIVKKTNGKTTDIILDNTDETKTSALSVHVGDFTGTQLDWHYVSLTKQPSTKDDVKQLLIQMLLQAYELLNKAHYEGYYGSFTAFGFPYIRHGDHVTIQDDLYPERYGVYLVKKVRYFGGSDIGLRQEIHLDYRVDINKQKNLNISMPSIINQVDKILNNIYTNG